MQVTMSKHMVPVAGIVGGASSQPDSWRRVEATMLRLMSCCRVSLYGWSCESRALSTSACLCQSVTIASVQIVSVLHAFKRWWSVQAHLRIGTDCAIREKATAR